jgi:hypothetical protein
MKPLAVSIREFCRITSLGRTSCFQLIRENKIEARRVLGRTLILTRSVEALLELGQHQDTSGE